MFNVMSSFTDPIKSANGHEMDKGRYQGIRGTCQQSTSEILNFFLVTFKQ